MPETREIAKNDVVRKVMWTGLLAVTSAVATVTARKASQLIWMRVFAEEPPE